MTAHTVTLRITVDSRGGVQSIQQVGAAVRDLGQSADQTSRQVDRAAQASSAMSGVAARLSSVIGGIGLGAMAVMAARVADQMSNMDARLRITARTTEEYAAAQGLVLRLAQETRQDLGATAELYTRLTVALRDTGVSQAEVARMTATINKAFLVSGASASEASAAVRQLSQGLAAGALRGDEFNSVAEQAPRLMEALAKSLGVTRGELRKMAEDGKITASVIREALAGAASEIDAEFQQLPITIGGGLQQVKNALASLIGYVNSQTGASSAIGRFFTEVAGFVENLPAVFLGMAGRVQAVWAGLVANARAAGVLLQRAIMVPLNEVLERASALLRGLASAVAELPDALGGSDAAASLQRFSAALQSLQFTREEYLSQMREIARERDEELERIQRLTAAAQDEWIADRQRAASTQEYAAATRAATAAAKEHEQATRSQSAAERALAQQRLPLLESFIAETRARRELAALVAEADAELMNELRLAGAVGEERERLSRAIAASNFARQVEIANQRAGNPLTKQEIEQLRQLYEERLNLIAATEQGTRAQEEANRQMQDFAGTYLAQATDAIADFVTRGIRRWSDLWGAFKDIARRALADFIAAMLRQQIVVPIVARITAQGGGLAGRAGGAGGFGNVAGLGGLLGGGFAAGTGVMGAAIGATGSLFGGISAATSFGLSSLAAGNLGVGLGALAGPIGLAIAAVTLLRGLFGSNKPPDIRLGGASAAVRNQEGTITGSPFGDIRAGSRGISYQQFAAPIQQFDQAIAAIVRSIGGGQAQLDAIRERLSTWSVDLRGSAATVENVLGSRFEAILSTFSQDVQDFVRAGATMEERLARLNDVLTRPARAAALLADVLRDDMLAGMTEVERETFLINERFDAYRKQLEELGATVEQITQLEDARGRALARLRPDAEEMARRVDEILGAVIRDDTLAGMTQLDRELFLVNERFDRYRAELEALGASVEQITRLEDLRARALDRVRDAADRATDAIDGLGETMEEWYRRQGEVAVDIQRRTADALRGVADSLADYLRGSLFGSESVLTPMQQLEAARAQFAEAVRGSLYGATLEQRIASAQSLSGIADTLRRVGRGFYGSSDAFTELDRTITQGIGSVITAFGGALPAGLLPGQAANAPVVAGLGEVRAVLIEGQSAMIHELKRNSDINQAILEEMRGGGSGFGARKVRIGGAV